MWDAASSLAANGAHSACKVQTQPHAGVWLSPSHSKADVEAQSGGCSPRATSQTPAGSCRSGEGGRKGEAMAFLSWGLCLIDAWCL